MLDYWGGTDNLATLVRFFKIVKFSMSPKTYYVVFELKKENYNL